MIISKAEEMNPSKRPTMEDCVVYHPCKSWNCGDETLAYLGVYDGHGGREIVDFLEANLSSNIAQELRRHDENNLDIKNTKSNVTDTTLERMECGFLLTDIQSSQAGILSSGATAVVCLVKKHESDEQNIKDGITIYAANCGDARAVLSTSSSIERLTCDHRANEQSEQERIESCGGFVVRNRVLGVLAVSRSFGDHAFKQYIICRPYMKSLTVPGDYLKKESNNTFLILACDGLWDVMKDEEAVEFVKDFVIGSRPSLGAKKSVYKERKHKVAQALVHEALKKGSSDNISVLVAWL